MLAFLLALPLPADGQTFKGSRVVGSAPDGAFVYADVMQWEEPRSERNHVEVHAPDGQVAIEYSLCVGDCGFDDLPHDRPLPPDARCVLRKAAAARGPGRLCAWEVRGSYAPLQALPLAETHGGPRAVAALLSDIQHTLKLIPLVHSRRSVEVKIGAAQSVPYGIYAKEPWGLAYLLDLPPRSVDAATLLEAQGKSAFLFLDYAGRAASDSDAIHAVAWIPIARIAAMRLFASAAAALHEVEAVTKKRPSIEPLEEKRTVEAGGPRHESIRFLVRDEQGLAVQRIRYVAKVADGKIVEGRTPLTGLVEIRGLARGDVEVTFPDFDAGGWKGARPSPTVGEATVHKAGARNYLPAVAWRHGFADWRHFKVHADPTALEAGDELHFPAPRPPLYRLATGREHIITVKRPRSRLSIKIEPPVERWRKSSSYSVDFSDGQHKHKLKGRLGADLAIKEMLPLLATDIEIHAVVIDQAEGYSLPMDWPISFRGAPRYESEEGDWARLDCPAERSHVSPEALRRHEKLVAAIEAVEQSQLIEPHFRPSRTLHTLLLGRARIPWPAAQARLLRSPDTKENRCFGPDDFDGRRVELDDANDALAEYSLNPDFKTWVNAERGCR